MLRSHSVRWAAVLLTALALLAPVFDAAGDTAKSAVVSTAGPNNDMIWG